MPMYHSPPYYAKQLRIGVDKIHNAIDREELRAVNVSEGTERPRWRISEDDWQDYLNRRSNIQPPKPTRRRKAAASSDVIEFYK